MHGQTSESYTDSLPSKCNDFFLWFFVLSPPVSFPSLLRPDKRQFLVFTLILGTIELLWKWIYLGSSGSVESRAKSWKRQRYVLFFFFFVFWNPHDLSFLLQRPRENNKVQSIISILRQATTDAKRMAVLESSKLEPKRHSKWDFVT